MSDRTPSDRADASAGARNAALDEIMGIRRRSVSQVRSEEFALGTRLNEIRELLRIQNDNLRLARALLEEIRNQAPPPFIPVPLHGANSGKKGKIGRGSRSALVEIILNAQNQDSQKKHAGRLARQEQIVSELEQEIQALEAEDRETLAQIEDKVRERVRLRMELRSRHGR